MPKAKGRSAGGLGSRNAKGGNRMETGRLMCFAVWSVLFDLVWSGRVKQGLAELG